MVLPTTLRRLVACRANNSISKIAGEVVARPVARVLGVPTTIARLNVPYGDNGGWPYYKWR